MPVLSPPRLALWIIDRATPARDRDAVVGDVIEDFQHLAAADPAAARRWCRRQAWRSLVPGLRRQWATDSLPPSKGRFTMRGFFQDLRFGLRLLRHQPMMAAAGAVSLAIGLGLNILLFTLANAILLRTLPAAGADRLVMLEKQRETETANDFSYPAFLHLREQSAGVFDTLVAFTSSQALARTGTVVPEWINGEIVSGNMFGDFGVEMAHGRPLTPDDDRDGAQPAIVVSHLYWQRRFAGQTLGGQTLTLNNQTFTIAGVAGPSFLGLQLGRDSSYWLPIAQASLLQGRDLRSRPTTSWLGLLGRLSSGTPRDTAVARLSPAWTTYSGSLGYGRETMRLLDGSQGGSTALAELAQPLRLLSAASLFVLLIACVNVANLQLARAASRGAEFAVRAALGAGRVRIASLLVADAIILTVPAGLGALGGAVALREPASRLIARAGQPVTLDLSMDIRVLAVALALTVAAALVVGALSAWFGTRKAPALGIAGAGRSSVGGAARTQRVMVVVQFALSMTLVAGAALLVRTVSELRSSDMGFTRDVALLAVAPSATMTNEESARYYDLGMERLKSLPGVETVAVAAVLPIDFGGSRRTIAIPGYTPAPNEEMEHNVNRVSADYFELMGIPLIAGRVFDARDMATQPRRVVINETMAKRYFPGGQAVGRTMSYGTGPANIEVIGVVRDARYRTVREAPRPSWYVPVTQEPAGSGAFHVRTTGRPDDSLGAMERALAGIDPRMAVRRTLTLDAQLDRNIANERMARSIAVVLGLSALLLAATGLYATMAFAVRRRTREIGVRMALGAGIGDVRFMIVRQSLTLVAMGVAAGLAGAIWAGRAVESQLYGVSPVDFVSFAGAAMVLGASAVIAAWQPARRATRIDPVVALRDQ
ncbi:MAG: ADOP family duplicated permease [Vicinamibacterales bacterium]